MAGNHGGLKICYLQPTSMMSQEKDPMDPESPRGLYSFCEDISPGKTFSKAVNSYGMGLSR